MQFLIQEGNSDIKSKLQSMLHERGPRETGLKEFLVDLEETENLRGSWWVAVDYYGVPKGALTVRYINNFSYLKSLWTDVDQIEDATLASKALFDEWMKVGRSTTEYYQVDLSVFSPLIHSLEELGFQKEKILQSSYSMKTGWFTEELPEGYTMRGVETEELSFIYDHLIGPDLDPSSPIWVEKEGFTKFASELPDTARNSWVGVEDDDGEIVGFGASFLTLDRESSRAVLYGPHSKEPKVIRAIVSEMATFWKSRGVDSMLILRVMEFHPAIIEQFHMKLFQKNIRFIAPRQDH